MLSKKPVFKIDPDEINDSYKENMKERRTVLDIIDEKISNNNLNKICKTVATNCVVFANRLYLLKMLKKTSLVKHAARAFITPQSPTMYGDNYVFMGDNVVTKIINYQPSVESEFDIINEIAMQMHASSLETTCNIEIPRIINYGKVVLSENDIYALNRTYNTNYAHTCFFYFSMEKIENVTLERFVNNAPTEICKKVIENANKANECLMLNNFYHNDFHGNNVLVDPDNYGLTIIDFGNATDHKIHSEEPKIKFNCENKGGFKTRGKTCALGKTCAFGKTCAQRKKTKKQCHRKKTRGGAIIDSINKLISAKISYGAPLLTQREKQAILGSILANPNDNILETIDKINNIVTSYEKINLLGNGIPSTELDGMYDNPVDYDNDPRLEEPPVERMLFADLLLKTIITRLYKTLLHRNMLYSAGILTYANTFRTTFLHMITHRVSCYIIKYYYIDSFGNQYKKWETTTAYINFVKELLLSEIVSKTNNSYGITHKIEKLPAYFKGLYQVLLENEMIIHPNQ